MYTRGGNLRKTARPGARPTAGQAGTNATHIWNKARGEGAGRKIGHGTAAHGARAEQASPREPVTAFLLINATIPVLAHDIFQLGKHTWTPRTSEPLETSTRSGRERARWSAPPRGPQTLRLLHREDQKALNKKTCVHLQKQARRSRRPHNLGANVSVEHPR